MTSKAVFFVSVVVRGVRCIQFLQVQRTQSGTQRTQRRKDRLTPFTFRLDHVASKNNRFFSEGKQETGFYKP